MRSRGIPPPSGKGGGAVTPPTPPAPPLLLAAAAAAAAEGERMGLGDVVGVELLPPVVTSGTMLKAMLNALLPAIPTAPPLISAERDCCDCDCDCNCDCDCGCCDCGDCPLRGSKG